MPRLERLLAIALAAYGHAVTGTAALREPLALDNWLRAVLAFTRAEAAPSPMRRRG